MIHVVIRHAAVIAPHFIFSFKPTEAALNHAVDSILSLEIREMTAKTLIIGKNIVALCNRQTVAGSNQDAVCTFVPSKQAFCIRAFFIVVPVKSAPEKLQCIMRAP